MSSKPKQEIRFSYLDCNARILLESVRQNDLSIVYFKYDLADPSNSAFVQDYYIEARDTTIVPPPRAHEYLTVQNVMLPELFGDPSSIAEWIARLSEEELTLNLQTFLERYLVVSPQYLSVLAAYIKFTWVHERSFIKPYLHIWGDKGTGKSTIVEAGMQYVCRYAIFYAGGVTPASLMRAITLLNGTSIIDETDFRKDSESLEHMLAILRSGYKESGTYSLAEPDAKSYKSTLFKTGNPKIIIGRKPINDDALRSRCLELEMIPQELPAEKRKTTETWVIEDIMRSAQELTNRLLLYRLKHLSDRNELTNAFADTEARLMDTSQALWYCLHTQEEKDNYTAFISKNSNDIRTQFSESLEGEILNIIVEQLPLYGLDQSIKSIADRYREKFKDEISFKDMDALATPKRFAYRLRGMGIPRRHREGGNSIALDETLLFKLCDKYGIGKPSSVQGLNQLL